MDLPVPVLIALVSTGIGMLLLTAQGSTAKLGSVPHRQWPAEGGAASVAADRTPVVLKGSPVTQWAALSRWSPEHISAHGPDVLRLVWHSAGPCLVYASESGDLGGGRRMAGCDEGGESALAPEPRAMRPAELFAAAARGIEPGVLYWQDELARLGPQLTAEVEAAPLGLGEVEGGEVAQLAWIGTRGATTQAHYDMEHNFFAQLYGTKRFVLWPPRSHTALQLHPTRHSRHRQSQLDDLPDGPATPSTLATPANSAATATPATPATPTAALAAAAAAAAGALRVELSPGQLLYALTLLLAANPDSDH